MLNSAQPSGKNIIENVTAKNYLKETLMSILCFIIQGKGSSGKSLILKFCFVAYGNLTRLGLLFSSTQRNRKAFSSNSKYVVCFNKFFAGKGFVRFPAFVNLSSCVIFQLNKFAFVG